MRRKTHIFLVAIDEDPIPGAMDATRIMGDVTIGIKRAFTCYNPQVVPIGSTIRDSNFARDVTVDIHPDELTLNDIRLRYSAEQPRE